MWNNCWASLLNNPEDRPQKSRWYDWLIIMSLIAAFALVGYFML